MRNVTHLAPSSSPNWLRSMLGHLGAGLVAAGTLRVERSQFTSRQPGLEIRPGLLAEGELQSGGKTILQNLLKPLRKSSEAFREC